MVEFGLLELFRSSSAGPRLGWCYEAESLGIVASSIVAYLIVLALRKAVVRVDGSVGELHTAGSDPQVQ
jgi:hypothetical protein